MEEQNILYMAVCYNGRRINVHARNILEAAEAIKKSTQLDPKDPEYINENAVFMIIDIPG